MNPLRVDFPCVLYEDLHSQVVYACNLTERDLAIFVSYSGSTSEICLLCEARP